MSEIFDKIRELATMIVCRFGSEKLKQLDGYFNYLDHYAKTEEEREATKEKICSLLGSKCDDNDLVIIGIAVNKITHYGCDLQIWIDSIINSTIKSKKPLLEMINDSLEQEQKRIQKAIKTAASDEE